MTAVRLSVATASDIGRVRTSMQDVVHADPFAEGSEALLIVADGMGGAPAGDVASRLAVDTFLTHVRDQLSAPDLAEALHAANAAVHAASQADPQRAGMGTTLTAAWISGDSVRIAHAGDTRAYLLRAADLRQLSEDHTRLQELIRAGRASAAGARDHPARNILTRALGVAAELEGDLIESELAPGDTLLIASDGLHGVLPDERIGSLLATPDLPEALAKLIVATTTAGGPDNVGLAAARLLEDTR